jgi:hypothetical protein
MALMLFVTQDQHLRLFFLFSGSPKRCVHNEVVEFRVLQLMRFGSPFFFKLHGFLENSLFSSMISLQFSHFKCPKTMFDCRMLRYALRRRFNV